MENRVAVLAIVIVAILAGGITAIVQPQLVETVTTTTEISVATITKTITETLSKPTTTMTRTTTVTATTTSETTLIRTTTVTTTTTSIVTTTVTQTPTEAPSINLVSIQEDKAASWSKTHLRILVRPEGTRRINPDLQVVDAVGSAVDQWRRSIAQFTESNPKYTYLGSLVLTVYVQGENDTSLRRGPDIDITFTDRLTSSLIGETKLLVTILHSISYAEIAIGVQDLSLRGLHNVLTHELGHALGLEHSGVEDDLMYSEREKSEVREEILCPSTLDLYALALIYQWLETGSYSPYNAVSVTLPEAMKYEAVACNQQ